MAWPLSATSSYWAACKTAVRAGFGRLSYWSTERQGDPRGAHLKCQDPWFCLDDLYAQGQSLTLAGPQCSVFTKILPGRFASEILLGSDVRLVNLEF